MTYKEATKLKVGDVVRNREGKNTFSGPLRIQSIEVDDDVYDKNVFVRCDDRKLYHHSGLVRE